MRILWQSNSPFCNTGYGMQTASCVPRLESLGHDMAVYAFYGFEGSKIIWEGIPIYGNEARDWGQKFAPVAYEDFNADILLTLEDTWVLQGLGAEMNWVPWTPIDHDPAPPDVLSTLKNAPGLLKPIAMSRFGQAELKKQGIDAYYIPHGVNTHLFTPNSEWRAERRQREGWEDKFVVGTVATNSIERKNWIASLKAIKEFTSRHDDVIYYMHTEMRHSHGIDLHGLRYSLGLENVTYFPKIEQLVIGVRTETLAHLYNAFDVFLLPSKGEGFGIPIIEAQACSVPVITTNCTAQPELLGGGWLIKDLYPIWTGQASWQFECKPQEIVEYLEAAYQAKKDGSIVDLQQKARQKALEYEWDELIPNYWKPTLEDIEQKLKEPKNLEGVQPWRAIFIPANCIPRKVLDIGCGVTQPYRPVLEKLGEYTGVDIKEAPNVKTCNAEELPFADKEFGFVWMSELLEHVNNPKRALDEAQRVGIHGVAIFSTPLNPYFKMDPEHKVVNLPYAVLASGDGLIVW